MHSIFFRAPVLQDAFESVSEKEIQQLCFRQRLLFPQSYIDLLTQKNGGRFAQMAVGGTINQTHVSVFYSIGAGHSEFDLEKRIEANRGKSGRTCFTLGSTGLGRLLLIRSTKGGDSPVLALDYATNKTDTVSESLTAFLDSILYSPEQDQLWTEAEDPFTFIERGDVTSVKEVHNILSLKSNRGQSPLACAIASLQPRAVELLLTLGADPNELDNNGLSPLMIACESGGVEICDTLLKAGANAELTNPDGMTAFDIAVEEKCSRIIDILTFAQH